jgi:uncharacterized membrane protein
MVLLGLAVAIFAAVHLIPAAPPLKARLAAACGPRWGLIYGLAATAGLVAIILAFRAAPFVAVYDPPAWGHLVALALMAVAFLLVGVFLFRGRLRHLMRFPLAIAVILWGIAHLFANGDLRALILFGGLTAYGLAHFGLGWANGVRPAGDARAGHDLMAPVAGLALYVAMVQLHPVLIGVPVLGLP